MKRNMTSVMFFISFVSMLVLGLFFRVPSVQASHCFNATLAGTWGCTCQGSIVDAGPVSTACRLSYDGQGNFSGTADARFPDGTVVIGIVIEGTYSLNPNCTFTTTQSDFIGGELVQFIDYSNVLIDDKREYRGLLTRLELLDGTDVNANWVCTCKRL